MTSSRLSRSLMLSSFRGVMMKVSTHLPAACIAFCAAWLFASAPTRAQVLIPTGTCVVNGGVVATRNATATACDGPGAVREARSAASIAARDAGKTACPAQTAATRAAICAARGLRARSDIGVLNQIIPATFDFAVPAAAAGRCVAVRTRATPAALAAGNCFLFIGTLYSSRATARASCGVMCQ